MSQLLAAICFGASLIFLLAALRKIPRKLAIDSSARAETDVSPDADAPVCITEPHYDSGAEDVITQNTESAGDTDETTETDKEDDHGQEETESE